MHDGAYLRLLRYLLAIIGLNDILTRQSSSFGEGPRGRGSSGVWHHGGLEYRRIIDPGAWYDTVREGGCRFMGAWVKEEEKAPENWQRNREREVHEADKIEVAPGVTVGSLRRFRAVFKGPTRDSRSGVGCADREA